MAKTIQKANTPPSESTEVRTAGPSATGALNGEHESEAACQPNGLLTDSDEETIRALAHSKWEAAGCPPGDGFDFWLQAEREVRAKQSGSNAAQG
jgi:hypothetical protein